MLVAVRNDDALLGTMPESQEDHADTEEGANNLAWIVEQVSGEFPDIERLFSRAEGFPEREITLDAFNTLFQGEMSVEDLRAALKSTAKVWTWTRLREKAEQAGQSAESAARALGLAGGASD